MNDTQLNTLRDLIQVDIGKRGLATDPEHNLVNAWPDDFRLACHSLAEHPRPVLGVVTGFFIASATPPAGETDGPLGALFLARALTPLGIRVVLVTDDYCQRALDVGLATCGLRKEVPIIVLPTAAQAKEVSEADYWRRFAEQVGTPALTHLLAIERVGPNHLHETIPLEHRNRCHSARGRDITEFSSPAHRLFEWTQREGKIVTIGIGDGGNEIGMGKIPWKVIERNVPHGGLIACRVATQYLLVCGISNWGGYALAAGVSRLRGQAMEKSLFDTGLELDVLTRMVEEGGLVDGVLGRPSATVDGLTWEDYAGVLTRIGATVNV
jgi:hypothetical protein